MKTEELDYYLPTELIAQQPCDIRSKSRLLVYNRQEKCLIDSEFNRLGEFLSAGDCLVLNDTKVIQARFFARRQSGGKLEGLFLNETGVGVWEVILKGAGKLKTGEVICLLNRNKEDFCKANVLEKPKEGLSRLRIDSQGNVNELLEEIGFAPLPPYIKRSDDAEQAVIDKQRYQTVYAQRDGAVAAPTAGLHFTEDLIGQLKENGIRFAFVTLHVGLGTFKPITTENLEEHQIHPERFSIDEKNVKIINETKEKGGRVIAVGTTSVRVLETVAENGRVGSAEGVTDLFIVPGYKFKMVDAMVTNFHLPRSSLLALVGAFAGLENILDAYKHAIEKRYRFYSYGDAMFIL